MLTLRYQENDLNTANLHLRESRISKVSPLTPSVVNITSLCGPERRRVEEFIRHVYKESYGADIEISYPVLMSVRDAEDNILAAVGFRYAREEPLFLEQYTKQPIEKILNCRRDQVAEIGNLASAGKGASIFLFAALASYLDSKGIRHAVVTGTDFLHRYFEKIGLAPQRLCDADISDIGGGGKAWGTYYDTHPRVLAGSVERGVRRLKATLGVAFEDLRPRLYPRLHYKEKA